MRTYSRFLYKICARIIPCSYNYFYSAAYTSKLFNIYLTMHARFSEVDFFRGLAVIGMIVYHFFFLLNFFGLTEVNILHGVWLALARFVQLIFLLGVGISLALVAQKYLESSFSKRRIYKIFFGHSLIIAFCASVITGFTWLIFPTEFVRFGILHLIASSILLLSSTALYPRVALVIGILVIMSTPIFQFLPYESYLYPFGGGGYIPALDYFPFFPWLSLPAFGIALGHFAFKKFQRRFPAFLPERHSIHAIAFFGRHSLVIYMIHIPALFGIIVLFA